MKEVVAGVDIGGTNTAIGLTDREGNILSKSRIRTRDFATPSAFVDALVLNIREQIGTIPEEIHLNAIGIGAPNGNYYKGTIEFAPNLQWEGIVPLRDLIAKGLHSPVVLTNDANAAAVGEMLFGNAQGYDHFIEITIGTGLGSGIVVNGELLYGHDGFAGEIGHTCVIPDGRRCTCGRMGCLETYVSARGVMMTVAEMLHEPGVESTLREANLNEITPRELHEAACAGDPIAIRAFAYTGEILGRQLADSVAYTSPEAIFLFGGVARAGDFILLPTKESMEKNLLQIYKNKVKILQSGLNGKDAAILGAGALAWKTLED